MKKNDILILLIPSMLIVIMWVVFSVYHNYITSTIPENLNTQILSISPDFDLKTIENLKKRNVIIPIYQLSAPTTEPDTQSAPALSSPEISSSSATQASQGGSLQ